MPKGVFKGTDEELKKLSEFVAKYNKKLKADYKICSQLFYCWMKFVIIE